MLEQNKEKDNQNGENAAENAGDSEIESLKKELIECKEKADELLRQVADYDNQRKRAEASKIEMISTANWELLRAILPALDDMERAFNTLSVEQNDLKWVEGFRLIHKKLQAILDTQGITEIEASGKPFDPNLHEAVAHVEGDDGIVIDVIQKGYRLKDKVKVLRPALVSVGKGIDGNPQ